MAEPKGKPPHAGERLTREDVLRLIEEHGGPDGLDLSHRDLRHTDLGGLDLQRADLSGANLEGAVLWLASLQEANLSGANLQEADLSQSSLQGVDFRYANLYAADLSEAQLDGANLWSARLHEASFLLANLEGANLSAANLQRADLRQANLRRVRLAHAKLRDANLEGAHWGDYVLSEEIEGNFWGAAHAYRALKQWHTEAGIYGIAGEFHYRQMEAQRKLAWTERRLPYASALYALRFLYGYGERPERVIGWVVAVILGFALGHWAFGTVERGFLDALYYSAVSFTALGYGAWAPEPQGWAGKFLGVSESLLGVFMMALFLVTFTRKMTR